MTQLGKADRQRSRAGLDRLAIEEAKQVVGQLPCGGIAFTGELAQTFQTDDVEIARHGNGVMPRRVGVMAANLFEGVEEGVLAKGRPTAEAFIEDGAQRMH